jgi:transposase-like protein
MLKFSSLTILACGPVFGGSYNHSGNSRNGTYKRNLRTSAGDHTLDVSRDREATFKSGVIKKHQTSSNELEDKIISMYARGMTVRDISDSVEDMYGAELSPGLVSDITDKILPLATEWQGRILNSVYPIIYLDALHVKLKKDGKIVNVAIYNCLGVDLEGKKDMLGMWVSDGSEGANYWLSVITELKNRGVKDVLIACVDGLKGFKDAINSVFPETIVQKCVIHQIRNSLRYVSWKDKKEFAKDMKEVYQATTKELAEENLIKLSEKWSDKYRLSVKSWEDNWEELSEYFQFDEDIRRIIYTTNMIEGYHRQIRKVIKTKSVFPTPESVHKILYLATTNIMRKWTLTIRDWPQTLNQLTIRFEDRITAHNPFTQYS